MEEHARPAKHKNTPPGVFLPAFLKKQQGHFAEAVGAPTSEESASGCLSLGVKKFRFQISTDLVEPVSSTP